MCRFTILADPSYRRCPLPGLAGLLLLAGAASCLAEAETPRSIDPAETTASSAAPDVLRAEVEAADRRFNRAARERDRDDFHAMLDKDSVFLAGELHRGRLAVMAIWQHLFDGKYDFRYEAELLDASVARSGDLAWSVGSVRTSFQRPGMGSQEVIDGHYLHVWRRGEQGAWRLSHGSSLVVHPSLGAARDPRSGLMTAWPELADQIGAEVEIRWSPEALLRAASGELAFSFGEYEASFQTPDAEAAGVGEDEAAISGKGHFLAVWQKDHNGHWQLAAEGLTPPGIYGAG